MWYKIRRRSGSSKTLCGTHSSRRLDALAEAEEDDEPGESQTAQQRPADAAHVLDAIRDLQHVASETGTRTGGVRSSTEHIRHNGSTESVWREGRAVEWG